MYFFKCKDDEKCQCSFLHCANKIGLLFVFFFILCFTWHFIRPVEPKLHLDLLKLSFFGFSGMNFLSFVFGVIQAYIWGYIATGLWYLASCCGNSCKKSQ